MNQLLGKHGTQTKPGFTEKQGQYLAFIWAYTCIHRRPPAEIDMRRHFNATPPAVHNMVLTLEAAGLITRQPSVPRSIALAIKPEHLPVLQPAPASSGQSIIISVQRY
jgi:hypothetical protein